MSLAPTPVFYFVSNFMENILLGPHSANCLRQMKLGGGSYFYGIVYRPMAHNSKCYKNVCQFIWLNMYDSYKHHSKYPFDNY